MSHQRRSPHSSIMIELVVADAAAAKPLPPGSVLLDEARGHECCGTLFGRVDFFGSRGLLLGRDEEANLHRRNRNELFVDQAGARHVSVERRAAFAQQPLDPVMLVKYAHGVREVHEVSLAGDDDSHVWM